MTCLSCGTNIKKGYSLTCRAIATQQLPPYQLLPRYLPLNTMPAASTRLLRAPFFFRNK